MPLADPRLLEADSRESVVETSLAEVPVLLMEEAWRLPVAQHSELRLRVSRDSQAWVQLLGAGFRASAVGTSPVALLAFLLEMVWHLMAARHSGLLLKVCRDYRALVLQLWQASLDSLVSDLLQRPCRAYRVPGLSLASLEEALQLVLRLPWSDIP